MNISDDEFDRLYEKYISDLEKIPDISNPADLKEIDTPNIQDYFSQKSKSPKDDICGHRAKEFARVNTKFLSSLIDQKLNNPDCAYVTCMDSLLSEGYTPELVSVMLKKAVVPKLKGTLHAYTAFDSFKEILSGRIMNYFGVATPYETLVKENGKIQIMSVDFVSPREEFSTFEQLNTSIIDLRLPQNISSVQELMDILYHERNEYKLHIKPSSPDMVEQFVYSYMVRNWIFNDLDFDEKNIGTLTNKDTKELKCLLNVDFERSMNTMGYAKSKEAIPFEMKLIQEAYPELFDRFKSKFKNLSKKNIFTGKSPCDDMIEEVSFGNNLMSYNLRSIINTNISALKSAFRSIENPVQGK